MSSSRSNRLWNSFQFLALCVFIVAVIEPSDADPDSNCKGKVCQKEPKCKLNSCLNGGSCLRHVTDDEDYCLCSGGWTGLDCSEKDYCNPQPCVHGTCNNGDSSYTCTCDPGYIGTNCDTRDYCYSQSCGHGTCNNGVSSHTCTCDPGYTGTNCDTQDYCYSQSCGHGTCNNGVSSYTCTCDPGYTGTNCDTSNDVCAPNPCQNGGTCVPGINGGFKCLCVYPPWYETLCDLMDGPVKRR